MGSLIDMGLKLIMMFVATRGIASHDVAFGGFIQLILLFCLSFRDCVFKSYPYNHVGFEEIHREVLACG